MLNFGWASSNSERARSSAGAAGDEYLMTNIILIADTHFGCKSIISLFADVAR